jgi:hypothetical protein
MDARFRCISGQHLSCSCHHLNIEENCVFTLRVATSASSYSAIPFISGMFCHKVVLTGEDVVFAIGGTNSPETGSGASGSGAGGEYSVANVSLKFAWDPQKTEMY